MENIVKEIESGEDQLFHFQSVHREKIVYLRSENLLKIEVTMDVGFQRIITCSKTKFEQKFRNLTSFGIQKLQF